ncbi:MAG: hypothetical protein DDG60_04315 [Anaerolineae bacterium]|nr:MAG: hypothetical protein DDG60_04315 [Anaerolineae bacterium]
MTTYQVAPVDWRQVFLRVRFENAETVAPLILCISPCRSGSTVLLRVFGASGIPSFYQPWKNVLRWAMQGVEWFWDFPTGSTPVFVKETIGPYTLTETKFNPFELVQAIHYPLHKLRLMLVARDPLQTWVSWQTLWGEKTRFEIFYAAFEQVETIRRQIQSAGLPLVHFVYEAVRDYGAESAIRGLFAQLGLPFTRQAITGWFSLPPFGEDGSNIFYPQEPPVFSVPNIHEKVETADSLEFFARSEPFAGVPVDQVDQIRHSELQTWYETWRRTHYAVLDAQGG